MINPRSGMPASLLSLTIASVLGMMPAAGGTQGGAAALRAATEYISKEKVRGPVDVDPREYVIAARDSSRAERSHSPATLTLLAVPGVATVASLGRARQCADDPSPPSCKSGGRAAFISLGAPKIDGRNAIIELRVATARAPTRADSTQAQAMTSVAQREAHLLRLSRASIARYRLDLVRETTAWVVVRAVLVGASE